LSETSERPARLPRQPALEVLAIADFRYLWLSGTGGAFAFSLRFFATSWLVLELTNSPFWVGLVGGVTTVPMIALGLFGGALAERWDRRRVLIAIRAMLAALTITTGLLVFSEAVRPWHLLVLSLGYGVLFAVFEPARWTFVVDLVGRQRIFAANALMATAHNVSEMAGPLMAGYVVAAYGVDSLFFGAGGLYVVTGLLLLAVRSRRRTSSQVKDSILKEIAAAIAFVRRTPPLTSMFLMVMTSFFGAAIIPMIPVYARDVLDAGPTGFGILGSSMGAGFLMGAILASLKGDVGRKALGIVLMTAVWDTGALVFAFSDSFLLSAITVFVMGVSGSIWFTLMTTLLQSSVPDEMRGRVMGMFTVANEFFGIGVILSGALASLVTNWFPMVVGVMGSSPLVLLIYWRSPRLRRM